MYMDRTRKFNNPMMEIISTPPNATPNLMLAGAAPAWSKDCRHEMTVMLAPRKDRKTGRGPPIARSG
jgi:hypothetical protein